MTDPDPRADGANPPQADTTEPEFSLQSVYLKDCSFEAPRGPRVEGQWSPAVNLDLNTAAEAISPELREVVLTVSITARNNDAAAFVVEVKQAGVFGMRNLNEADYRRAVGSVAPVPIRLWRAKEPRGCGFLQCRRPDQRQPEVGGLHRLDDSLKPSIGQLDQADLVAMALGREHRHAVVPLGLQRCHSVVPAHKRCRHQPGDRFGLKHAVVIHREDPVRSVDHVEHDPI